MGRDKGSGRKRSLIDYLERFVLVPICCCHSNINMTFNMMACRVIIVIVIVTVIVDEY